MGQFQFNIPENLLSGGILGSDGSLSQSAYLSGIENIPWKSDLHFDGHCLQLRRRVDESGKLIVPWNIPGYGPVMLSTCSLRPNGVPYHLPLELARGSCYRLRSQADYWQRSGLKLSDNFHSLLDEGSRYFLDAAQRMANPDASGEDAVKSIRHLEAASADLMESYAAQAIAFRRDHEGRLGSLLGAALPVGTPPSPEQTRLYTQAFNVAGVRLTWADVETDAGRLDFDGVDAVFRWAEQNGLRVIAGPLFDFQDKLLPHWLYLLEDRFDELVEAVCRFARQAVERYAGSVHLWNCAAGLNTRGPIDLTEEQIMRLAVELLQVVRQTDPRTPVIMSFDQPFGEYMRDSESAISPIHCADALIRSRLGLTGIGLELRMNYKDIGTMPRTNLDFSQMIDRWAILGLPLMCQLTVPAGNQADPLALRPGRLMQSDSQVMVSEKDQLRIGGGFVRTLLAKHYVHGIIWDGWDDSRPHVFPHSGLLDHQGQPRSLHEYLTRMRRDFLF